MSLLPYVLASLIPATPYGVYPGDTWITPAERSLMRSLSEFNKIWRSPLSDLGEFNTESLVGKDGFQVSLDVQHFAPNEISVKTVDNSILVDAKHEERKDEHGFISREVHRRYVLPSGFKAEDVVSTISSDGILTIKAPPVEQAVEGSKVREIQIQQTGPARLSVKNNEETKDDKENKENKETKENVENGGK